MVWTNLITYDFSHYTLYCCEIPGSNQLAREVWALEGKGKGSLQLLDDILHQLPERHVLVLVIDVLDQFGNGLCVGLWLKDEAFLGLKMRRLPAAILHNRIRSYVLWN